MDVAVEVTNNNSDHIDTLASNNSDTITATATMDTNGNDNTLEVIDHSEAIEDNINEAASEDSGMSSVDNHNMSGETKSALKCYLFGTYCRIKS